MSPLFLLISPMPNTQYLLRVFFLNEVSPIQQKDKDDANYDQEVKQNKTKQKTEKTFLKLTETSVLSPEVKLKCRTKRKDDR